MLKGWRIFIASLASLFLLVGAAVWYGGQQLEGCEAKKAAIEKATARAAALNELQLGHDNLEVYQMEVAKQRQMAERLLPKQIQMAELLAHVQQIAKNSGVALQELVPMERKIQGQLQVQPIKVRLQGDFFALLEFFRQLDKGAPLVQVGNMELKQQPEGLISRLVLKFYAG